jgi:hypothetical protein
MKDQRCGLTAWSWLRFALQLMLGGGTNLSTHIRSSAKAKKENENAD